MNIDQFNFTNRIIRIDDLPISIQVETVFGCNIRCKMCPVPTSYKNFNRRFKKMGMAVFDELLSKISDKRRTVRLNIMGEPLLHPDIVSFVVRAKEKGHRVEMTTNATLLSPQLGEQLIKAGVDKIIFSVDGYSKETYETIRVGTRHEDVVKNIRDFVEAAHRYSGNIVTEVDCILSERTAPEADLYSDFWSKIVSEVVFINLSDWAGQLQLPEDMGKSRGITDKPHRYPCHLLWVSLHLSAEGNVMLCCHDYKQSSNLPNIMKKDLRDIWIEDIKPFRIEHITGGISNALCLNCYEWKRMPERYQEPAKEIITNTAPDEGSGISHEPPIKFRFFNKMFHASLLKLIDHMIGSDRAFRILIDRIIASDIGFKKLESLIGDFNCGTNNQLNRDKWIEKTLKNIPAGYRILDAGAGELQYKKYCSHLEYVSQDFAKYDGAGDGSALQMGKWDQSKLDIVSDITSIPEPDASFDTIMCIEVLEHLPNPILAIKEFARLLKIGGELIITAPFCSLTHFAPYHFFTGFNRYFFETHLTAYGFEIEEITPSGNFFEFLAQEIRRMPDIGERYANDKPTRVELLSSRIVLNMLNRFSSNDTRSYDLLNYEYFVKAKKVKQAYL